MDIKTITATIALLGSGTLVAAGCDDAKKPAAEVDGAKKSKDGAKKDAAKAKDAKKTNADVAKKDAKKDAKGEMACGEGKCGAGGSCGAKMKGGDKGKAVAADGKAPAGDAKAAPAGDAKAAAKPESDKT